MLNHSVFAFASPLALLKALTDGTIEDDDGGDGSAPRTSSSSGSGSELVSHWLRIIQYGVNIANAVDGFNWVEGSSGMLKEACRESDPSGKRKIKLNKKRRVEGWVGGGLS